jgi:hypothetical protein
MEDSSTESMDLKNYSGRLRKLALAAMIGLVLTFFTMKGMTATGRGPNGDPVGVGSVGMLAIAMFVATTMFSLKILSKKRSR